MLFYAVLDRKEALLDYKNVSFSKSQKWAFSNGVNSRFWLKKIRFSSFFSILVKIRPEIMFNDVLNVKEASLENKDFFKGVNR